MASKFVWLLLTADICTAGWPRDGIWAHMRYRQAQPETAAALRVVHAEPLVVVYDHFLSDDEAAQLIELHESVAIPRAKENLTWCFRNEQLLRNVIASNNIQVHHINGLHWRKTPRASQH
jgi:hypothetical protein